ncbi:MAG: right-handed parallel beta-helix repeat-containing protein [Gemmatales bacterium]
MTAVRLGVQTGNFYAANPGSVAPSISNNQITSTRLGIFHNLQYSAAAPFTISGNTLTATTEVGGTTRWWGIALTSIQSAVGVTVSNNTIDATASTFQTKTGYVAWNNPTTSTVTISGGSVTGADYGVTASNNIASFFGDAASSSLIVNGVTITNAAVAGIYVQDAPANGNNATVAVSVTGNTTVSGSPTGILVSGSDASANINNNLSSIFGNVIGIDVNAGTATITSNSIYNNGTGIRFTNGGSGSVTSNNFLGPITNFLANNTDLRIDASAGAVTIGSGNLFGGGSSTAGQFANPIGYYFDNRSSQSYNLVGSGSTFNRSNGTAWTALSTGVLTDNFRIEDRLYHAPDNSASGLIRVVANTLYVTTPGTGASNETIQRGVDAASAGNIIRVEAGTFVENVIVDEEVTIWGAGQGSTIVEPAFVGANTGGGSLAPGSSSIFLVRSNNVTIRNLTADGNNPLLTSGEVVNGVDVDARNGIITDHATIFTPITSLTVQNVTVQNIWLRGIYASTGGGTFSFLNNTVQNVAADPASIGIFNFGGSGIISGNQVSQTNDAISANHSSGTTFSFNTITNSLSGIHTDNAGDGGGTSDLIHDNLVQSGPGGSYGIWAFVPYNSVQIYDNIVTDVDVGLAAFAGASGGSVTFANNQVDLVSRANSTGAYVTTNTYGYGSGSVNATFTTNTIKNAQTLLYVEQENAVNAFAIGTGLTTIHPNMGDNQFGPTRGKSNSGKVENGQKGGSEGIEFAAGGADIDQATSDSDGGSSPIEFISSPVVATVVLTGNIFDNTATSLSSTVGVDISGGTITFNAGNQILGSETGLRMSAAVSSVSLVGNTLNNLVLNSQTGMQIVLSSTALDNVEIDGTGVTYNGIVGNTVTNAQAYTISDNIQDAIDAGTLGFIRNS